MSKLQEEYSFLPAGKLICTQSGGYFKWYNRNDGNLLYIPKNERHLAEALAKKKLLDKQIKALSKEQAAIKSYLKILDNDSIEVEKLLSNPAYQELLKNIYQPYSKEIEDWLSADYISNTRYPEKLTRHSISGNILRSKSEADIDTALFLHHIPFRYEAQLNLDGNIIYPDFTLLHPITHQIIYWEHFGLVEDIKYRHDYLSKLNLYTSNGIIPSINLITSYETASNPFTLADAEKIITNFFGPALPPLQL